MKALRIAIFTNDYPPRARGGAGVIAHIQAQELERRGHVVRVFECPPTFLSSPIIVRLLHHVRDLWPRTQYRQSIVEWKPDILLTHNLTGGGIGTPSSIQAEGIPWVHILHDVQLIEPSGQIVAGELYPFLRAVWRKMWARLRRAAFGAPHVVISPTRWLLSFHERYGFFGSSQKKVIPNPLPKNIHDGPLVGANPCVRLSEDVSMLYVGRLDYDKGVDVLYEAWKRMGDDRPVLTLVGNGKLRAELEEKQKHDDRLRVVGSEPHERVLERMHESAIVVVPSRVYENQSTVILEALACGCRVIATDVGGIPETLGNAGWIVTAGNVDQLYKAFGEAQKNLLTDEQHRERSRILEEHDIVSVMDEAERILEELGENVRISP